MKDGEDYINKGHEMIEKGRSMKTAAEAQYKDFRANPAYIEQK